MGMKPIQLLKLKESKQPLSFPKLKTINPNKGGVPAKAWFLASEDKETAAKAPKTQMSFIRFPSGRNPVPNKVPSKDVPKEAPAVKSGDEQVKELIISNPDISAATLVNTIKSKGLEIIDAKQADASSSQPQLARAQKQAGKGRLRAESRFLESYKDNGIGPTRFKAILIEEGMGNLHDAFYYTGEAIKSAVTCFEGKKIFADHPSAIEEEARPERSVRDILGHFENVHVEESEDGLTQLVGDLVVLANKPFEWARGLIQHAIEYSEKFPHAEFCGLSINASGDAEEMDFDSFVKETEIPPSAMPKLQKAQEQGIQTIRKVSEIIDAVSCDLVTSPGARGRILSIIS
jgi:hypothetical protein